jgi:hypothetical protein
MYFDFMARSCNTDRYNKDIGAKYNYSCENPHEHDGAQRRIQLLRASGTKCGKLRMSGANLALPHMSLRIAQR